MAKNYYLDVNAHNVFSKENESKLKKELESIGIYGHPLASNLAGRKAALAIERARYKICELLGIKDYLSLCFTDSCTQANYWAIKIIQGHYGENISVQVSPYEHPSMDSVVKNAFKQIEIVELGKEGHIKKLNYSVATIFVGAQSEVGFLADFEKLSKSAKYLISDMAQMTGKSEIDLKELPIDIATFGGHKFGAPLGIGFLYLKNPNIWLSLTEQENYLRDRPGTPNIQAILGAAIALEDRTVNLKENIEKTKAFQKILEDGLGQLNFDIIGKNANRIPGTTFVRVPGGRGMEFLAILSGNDVQIGLGSACGSMYVQKSSIMKALGEDTLNTNFCRFSQFGEYNEKDAVIILGKVEETLKKLGV